MKKAHMKIYTAVLFLLLAELLLSLAGIFSGGHTQGLFSALSYLLPVLLFLFLLARPGEIAAHRPTRAGFYRVLPLLPLFLSAVLLCSALSGHLMQALGLPRAPGGATEDWPTRIFLHALSPAFSEELFCRMAIFSLLARISPRQAVWQSALLFSFLHADLYQMPYAFLAGLFLGEVVLRGGSVLYAILFHFCNNLLSLLLQVLPLPSQLLIALLLFCAAGGCFLYLFPRREKGEGRAGGWLLSFCRSPLLLYPILIILLMLL